MTIDAEDLIAALQSHDGESEYYLDLETGEVKLVIDAGIVGEVDEELDDLLESEPDRFLIITPLPSSEGWQIMADFIEQLPPGKARDQLEIAVGGSRPFGRFKDKLIDHLEVREKWFRFENSAMVGVVRNWLVDEGVDAELAVREISS